jgi:hypothetical protein
MIVGLPPRDIPLRQEHHRCVKVLSWINHLVLAMQLRLHRHLARRTAIDQRYTDHHTAPHLFMGSVSICRGSTVDEIRGEMSEPIITVSNVKERYGTVYVYDYIR